MPNGDGGWINNLPSWIMVVISVVTTGAVIEATLLTAKSSLASVIERQVELGNAIKATNDRLQTTIDSTSQRFDQISGVLQGLSTQVQIHTVNIKTMSDLQVTGQARASIRDQKVADLQEELAGLKPVISAIQSQIVDYLRGPR